MLDDEDADGGGGSFERNAKPGGRRRADEVDFALRGESIEFGLVDEHGAAGAEDEGGAGAGDFLRRRRRVELIGPKSEMESVGFGIVESDETVFGVEDFFQGA